MAHLDDIARDLDREITNLLNARDSLYHVDRAGDVFPAETRKALLVKAAGEVQTACTAIQAIDIEGAE